MRPVAACLLGIATALALLMAVEGFSMLVHPFPAGFQGTHEEICAHVERYPAWVLAAVVPMWAGAALVAVLVAGGVGRSAWPPRIVGAVIVSALGMNLWMLPYPVWFKASALLALCIAVVAGVRR